MQIYFPMKDPSASPHFLPKEEADSIPFSSQQLPYLLQLFSFQPDSTQASAVEEALTSCERSGIKGETKLCATSLESMLDFAQQTLRGGIKVLSTTHLKRSGTLLQMYTVVAEPEEVNAPRQVACHTLPYPYALFYCHSQLTENKVFMVSLAGEKGDTLELLLSVTWKPLNGAADMSPFACLGLSRDFLKSAISSLKIIWFTSHSEPDNRL